MQHHAAQLVRGVVMLNDCQVAELVAAGGVREIIALHHTAATARLWSTCGGRGTPQNNAGRVIILPEKTGQ
jgi:hypothetical protein